MSRHTRDDSSSDEERKVKTAKYYREEESHNPSHTHGHSRHDERSNQHRYGRHERRGGHHCRDGCEDSGSHRDSDDSERHRNSGRHSSSFEFDPHRRFKREPPDDFAVQSHERRLNDDRRYESRQQRDRDGVEGNFGASAPKDSGEKIKDKEKPNFELSGKLTEDTNTYRGVIIKYNEPPEASKPKRRWRLYPFKGDTSLPLLPIHRQSAYLLGRDRRVADIPVDHPSCSKQHAVLQYRLTDYQRPDGTMGRKVRPYIIDLGSANGTFVNNQCIDAQRYVELFERDVLKFGFSSREYVLLHENVDTSEVAEEVDSD